MQSMWRLFVNAKTEKGANAVVVRACARMQIPRTNATIDRYHKGGFVAKVTYEHEGGRADAIVEALSITSNVTRSIGLYGDIYNRPSGFSNDVSVSGLTAVSWDFVEG